MSDLSTLPPLTEEELQEAKILMSPWLFAEAFLQDPMDPLKPLRLRKYQRNILKDRHFRKILRMGRRTGKTVVLAIEAVYKAFTYHNRQILIVTAYEGQLDEIFNNIDHLCFDSHKIKNSISRVTRKPHKVELLNGSVITGNVGNNSVRGKCLPAGTQIWMADLSWKPIEEIKPEEKVVSWNYELDRPEPKSVTAVHDNGFKPIYEVSTRSGRFLQATSNHKVFTDKGEEIEVGDLRSWKLHQSSAHFITSLGIDVEISTLDGSRRQKLRKQYCRVNEVKDTNQTKQTYDITIEGNHNYVALFPPDESLSPFKVNGISNGGLLVHNSANDLIIDECDYIPESILLEAIWPIATTTKSTNVILSSTPTGRHEFFYNVSTNKNKQEFNFREFHIPSSESPEWTPEHESLVRATTDSIRYTREYCLVGNTPILSDIGKINIENLKIGSILYSDITPITATNHKFTGQKPCIRIMTDINSVEASTDHSFNTRNGKEKAINAKEINIQPINRLAGKPNDVLWGAIVGFLYGDGTLPTNGESVAFYSESENDLIRLKSIITKLLPNITSGNLNEKEPGFYQLRYYGYLPKQLIEFGCATGNRTLQQVNIPDFIRLGEQEVKSSFISALLSTDGNTIGADAHDRSLVLSFTKSKVPDGASYYKQINKLITEIGFESCVSDYIQPNGKICYTVYIRGNGSWVDFSSSFYKLIGYNLCERKDKHALALYLYAEKYKRLLNEKRNRFLNIAKLKRTHSYTELTHLYGITKKIAEKASNGIIPNRLYGRNEIESYPDFVKTSFNERGVYADIIGKENTGLKDTYNITVSSKDHSYVLANGMLTYNCAEFGEATEGVFRNKYIEPSLYVYGYSEVEIFKNSYVTMGVDWNEAAAGVRIVIQEHVKSPMVLQPYNDGVPGDAPPVTRANFFRLVATYNISAEDYTNTAGVDFILGLFGKFPIDYACFDRGHGHTNWELLRLALQRGVSATGKNCAGLKHMLNKMAVVDFGGTTEVIDVTTNESTKVRTKNLVVRNSVKMLENGICVFPAVETVTDSTGNERHVTVELEQNRLIGQMRDYSVLRTTDKGEVFSTGNDHTLDGWMLANHAFLINHDKFLAWDYSIEAEVIKSPILSAHGHARALSPSKPSIQLPTVTSINGITVRDHGLYPKQGEPPEEDDPVPFIGGSSNGGSVRISRNVTHTPRNRDI